MKLILIFITSLVFSISVQSFELECKKHGDTNYEVVKDNDGTSVKHDRRFNSLISDSEVTIIFNQKYIAINFKIIFNILANQNKNKPKIFLDNEFWKSFTHEVRVGGPANKTVTHFIKFNPSEFNGFKHKKKLDFIANNFEAEIDLTMFPLNKVLIYDQPDNFSCKKNQNLNINIQNNEKKKKLKTKKNNNDIKNLIVNRVLSYTLVTKAKFGHDEVGLDPNYKIFWIWMNNDNSKDFNAVASFFCPVLNEFGMGEVISIKETGTYNTLGRAKCR